MYMTIENPIELYAIVMLCVGDSLHAYNDMGIEHYKLVSFYICVCCRFA